MNDQTESAMTALTLVFAMDSCRYPYGYVSLLMKLNCKNMPLFAIHFNLSIVKSDLVMCFRKRRCVISEHILFSTKVAYQVILHFPSSPSNLIRYMRNRYTQWPHVFSLYGDKRLIEIWQAIHSLSQHCLLKFYSLMQIKDVSFSLQLTTPYNSFTIKVYCKLCSVVIRKPHLSCGDFYALSMLDCMSL